MINIDTRFIPLVDESEMWLLLHILTKVNKKNECFPSNETLCNGTGWEIKKLQRVKKSLLDRGILKIQGRSKKGRQTSNLYIIDTDLLSIHVPTKLLQMQGIPEEDMSPGGIWDTTPPPKMGQRSINQKEVLSKGSIEASPSPKTTQQKQSEFYNSLVPFVEKYGKDIVREFYEHWSEPSDKLLAWEIAKRKKGTFNIAGRLATWKRRSEQYKPNKPAFVNGSEMPERISMPETYHQLK
jgi:hypothetical protein